MTSPSAPAGTDGGWDSSSWVGIDGTYGSNDVLQAGVQQSVGRRRLDDLRRVVRVVRADRSPGSPAYIYQTNIDNLPIEPGDEVFAGVHYQNGQGYVMFGNVDRGPLLQHPAGCPARRDVQRQQRGVDRRGLRTAASRERALPRFTPVNFTAAMGSDANATASADPDTGDTSNIVAFGRSLTRSRWRPTRYGGLPGDGFFPVPGTAVFDHEKQQVAAVSRAPGNLDLFVIGFDNHVWTTFWNDQVGWNGDWFPLPGQAVFDREKQQIAAVSRAPGNLDLFVIGFDNHVWTTFWNDQVGWNGDWFPLPGQAVFDREKQQIAAVSRGAGQPRRVRDRVRQPCVDDVLERPGGLERRLFPLPGNAVFDREKQQIAAVSRAPGNLDVFVIGFDNHVWTTFWNDQVGWNGDFFPLPGKAVFDREKQQLAAVSRAPGNLDVFVIGFDNHVWTTFWNDQVGWNGDFFRCPGMRCSTARSSSWRWSRGRLGTWTCS